MGLKYCRNDNKGFSLLELIIATGVLSVGIIAVLQALSFSARSTGLSCDMIKAVFLAQDKLQELELNEKLNLIKEEAKQDEKDNFTLKYTINPQPGLNLFRLNLNINWQRGRREQELGINTYLKNDA